MGDYKQPDYSDATCNKLHNVNDINIKVVCPHCKQIKPSVPAKDGVKLINKNNINIIIDGCKVRRKDW